MAQGDEITHSKLKNLPKYFNAPHGSKVITTPSAYMTDLIWVKDVVPAVIEGIRSMPVVKDYPDWPFGLIFDGYASHLLPEGLSLFAKALIQTAKQEANTSHTNQA
jgi:hypothetical protein